MDTAFEARALNMAADRRFDEPVYVTRPNLPPLDDVTRILATAWERQWLTNEGALHIQLEEELVRALDVPHVNLFCNGTVALMTALRLLSLEAGNVITTAFTFPATVNVLAWFSLRPVFCDIDPHTYNMNPDAIERLITPETRAILPVHVYGTPCDVDRIQAIADRHRLPVVYDAAHAFGVRRNGTSILRHGSVSMLSFHATKIFTTAEGGALVTTDPELHRRGRLLKNFGITGEESVEEPGINGKLNELQAALGLAQLAGLESNRQKRMRLDGRYRKRLEKEPGLVMLEIPPGVEQNYAYFPVRVKEPLFGMNRDELHRLLKAFNIHCRKYFYPLCSTHAWCRVEEGVLPESEAAAREVLCLPLYSTLPESWVDKIADTIAELGALVRA